MSYANKQRMERKKNERESFNILSLWHNKQLCANVSLLSHVSPKASGRRANQSRLFMVIISLKVEVNTYSLKFTIHKMFYVLYI